MESQGRFRTIHRREEKIRSDFEIPDELSPTIIVGFGYLARESTGKRKDRIPIEKLVYYGKYGRSK